MGPRGGPLPTMHPPMPTIDAWLDDAMQSLSAAAKRLIGAAPSHTRGAKERTAGGQLAAMEKRMRSALSDLAAAPGGDSIARLIEQRVEQLGCQSASKTFQGSESNANQHPSIWIRKTCEYVHFVIISIGPRWVRGATHQCSD